MRHLAWFIIKCAAWFMVTHPFASRARCKEEAARIVEEYFNRYPHE